MTRRIRLRDSRGEVVNKLPSAPTDGVVHKPKIEPAPPPDASSVHESAQHAYTLTFVLEPELAYGAMRRTLMLSVGVRISWGVVGNVRAYSNLSIDQLGLGSSTDYPVFICEWVESLEQQLNGLVPAYILYERVFSFLRISSISAILSGHRILPEHVTAARGRAVARYIDSLPVDAP